jgi:hypothetical protein
MNLDAKVLLGPLLALVILGVIGQQTADALRRSGTGGPRRTTSQPPPDPYAMLDAQLALPDTVKRTGLRDPFSYGRAPAPIATRTIERPLTPPPPPRPVLTAILTDIDPRALVRYMDRDYTIKPGDQFADFKVISISADEVVLDRGGQRIALHRPTRGE